MRLQECKVCEEKVNHYPDDTCKPCREATAKTFRDQWEPSKTAHDAWRDKQSAGQFRKTDFEAQADRNDAAWTDEQEHRTGERPVRYV
jgi:hypothetical protein